MKMLSPVRAGLALSMLGAAIFGCDDGSMSDGGVGAAAGTTGSGASAGSNGVGGTSAAGAAGGTGGAASGGSAGSAAAGGSIGNGGSAGSVGAGGTGGIGAGGSAGSVGAGGAAGSGGSGGTGNDAPAPVVPGTCKSDLGGYQNGWVTWYTFSQGTELVHCSWGTHKGNGSPDKVDHVLTGNGTYFGAINTSDYESAATCGACVEVSRTDQNKKVTITIVDECPIGSNDKCVAGHIDLSQEAFKQLGDTGEGYLGSGKPGSKGQISWKYVPCPTGETVHFSLKEPSNVNWNQIVVSGNQYEIVKLEVRVNGAWVSAAREVYNYWQTPDGKMGASPYRVRVTDVNGSVLEADVPLAAGDHDSGVQFTCN